MVDDPLEHIVANFAGYYAGVVNTQFTEVNTSTTWQIINVQANCDIITLDSGLNEAYLKIITKKGRN